MPFWIKFKWLFTELIGHHFHFMEKSSLDILPNIFFVRFTEETVIFCKLWQIRQIFLIYRWTVPLKIT